MALVLDCKKKILQLFENLNNELILLCWYYVETIDSDAFSK